MPSPIVATSFKACLLLANVVLTLPACSGKPDDGQIQTAINNKLKTIPAAAKAKSSVASGVVTLEGTCERDSCSTLIGNDLQKIDGVSKVDDNLKEKRTDLTLMTSVQSVHRKYPGIQADVISGVIVLRGSIAKSAVAGPISGLETFKPKKIDNQLAIKYDALQV